MIPYLMPAGAALNAKGKPGLDAAVMCGLTGNAGAVTAQTQIKNPVCMAKAIMEQTPYVLLTGEGPEIIQRSRYRDTVPMDYFLTQHQLKKYFAYKHSKPKQKGKYIAAGYTEHDLKDTAGAVALDAYGNVAAAASAGGAPNCIPGRVSDSCIIGAGCYASNQTCAISGTGDGEYLITGLTAHTISMMMELTGCSLRAASRLVIAKYPADECDAGIIGVDREGNIAINFNSERMLRAWIDTNNTRFCSLYNNH
nr:isoaspartyl peptidase/L-asparaginase [Niabella ginsenosidivorans]